ncbi:MAG: hypothetical protein IPM18_17020 [Phycisphaerales bacterium]|nr:hypothetical protein [Phycisphaerales bacterium]
MNGDRRITFADINGFIAAVKSGGTDYVPTYVWLDGAHETGDAIYTIPLDSSHAITARFESLPGSEDSVEIWIPNQLGCEIVVNGLLLAHTGPSAPPGHDCAADLFSPYFVSRCHRRQGGWEGYPSLAAPKLAPNQFKNIPDLPLLSENTAPLVGSRGTRGFSSAAAVRRPQEGLIDLTTGVPLLKYVDFELPFGGATYRHVRTYGFNLIHFFVGLTLGFNSDGNGGDPRTWYDPTFTGAFWDWNGNGWMMSEHPVLFVDTTHVGLVGPGEPKRCYFFPDAHHSIPFIWSDVENAYIAPPWFDAQMVVREWVNEDQTLGSAFEIWLDAHSVKYTMRLLPLALQDLQAYLLEHDPPGSLNDVTRGFPYLALAESIEDRAGNRIEYAYCDFKQEPCEREDTDCVDCCQNCSEKGQLKAIRLVPAGESQAAWTLLYEHRRFWSWFTPQIAGEDERGNPHMLHAINVFRGEVPIPSGCLTIGATALNLGTLAALEQVEHPDVTTLTTLGYERVKRAVYTYTDSGLATPAGGGVPCDACPNCPEACEACADCPPWSLFAHSAFDGFHTIQDRVEPGHLVKATVFTSDGNQVLVEDVIYRYTATDLFHHSAYDEMQSLPSMIFEPAQLDPLYRAVPGGRTVALERLFATSDDDEIEVYDGAADEIVQSPLRKLPTYRFEYGLNNDHPVLAAFFEDELGWENVSDPQAPQDWTYLQTSALKTFYDRKANRRYDVWHYRARMYGAVERTLDTTYPYRCKYQDQNEYTISAPHDRERPVYGTCLRKSVWLNVPAGALGEPEDASYRILEANAAGFVLRDRSWENDEPAPGASPTLGVGYAEKFIYDNLGRLVERRSKGWSGWCVGPELQSSE